MTDIFEEIRKLKNRVNSLVSSGGGGFVDLSNYFTKSEVISRDSAVLTAAANANKDASTITGSKTSEFINDFDTAVDARIPNISPVALTQFKPLIRSQQTSGLLPVVSATPITVVGSASYNAWPSMIIDRLGRLQVVHVYGSSHIATNLGIKLEISSNGGITWTTSIITTPFVGAVDTHIIQMSNGSIGILSSGYVGSDGTNTKTYLSISTDNSATWGSWILVVDSYTQNYGPFATDIFEDNGILYVPFYVKNASDTHTSTFLKKSTDFGATWSSPLIIATAPTDTDFNECTLYRWRNYIVAYVRDETSRKLWRKTTTDAGATWSSAVDVTPPNWATCLPDPVCVGDMVHLVYRGTTQDMRRAVSWDGGIIWDASETIETSGQGHGQEYSKTLYYDGLVLSVYGMDQLGLTNANSKILQWRYGVAIGLDGMIYSDTVNVTPAAPTGGTVDDTANTFTFTPSTGIAATEHEYSLNGAGYITCTSNTISVGNTAVSIGGLLVRVKAAMGRNISATLSNATAFTVTSGGLNILPNSSSFDLWSTTRATVDSNVTTDQVGALTADKLKLGSAGSHWIRQNVTKAASSITYDFEVYVKSAEVDTTAIEIDDSTLNSGVYVQITSISGSTKGTTGVNGSGFTLNSSSIVADANGYSKITVNFTSNTDTGLAVIIYASLSGVNGNGTDGLYVANASLV